MTDLKDLREGKFNHLDSTRPEGARDNSVMTLEATVDVKPQELRAIRPYSESNRDIPTILPHLAQIVLHALFDCFDKQKSVKEGLISDLVWGFEQVGIPGRATVGGLVELEKSQYVRFQAPDNTYVDMTSTQIEKAFVRYQPKLLGMVYEGFAP